MEDNKKINITLAEGQKEVIIREGKAVTPLPLHEPIPVKLSGNINAPEEFLNKRKSEYKKEEVHLEFDEDNGEIVLVLNEKDFFKGEVRGKLLENTDLAEFCINDEDDKFDHKKLIRLIKQKKFMFDDASVHAKLLAKLSSFKAGISAQINQANDNKGNKNSSVEVKSDIDIIFDFVMNVSPFKGFAPQKFKVEICCDVRNINSIDFWFESTELTQLVQAQKAQIFIDKKQIFADYVIIEK